MSHEIIIPRASDRSVIKFFEELKNVFKCNSISISVNFSNKPIEYMQNSNIINEITNKDIRSINQIHTSILGEKQNEHTSIYYRSCYKKYTGTQERSFHFDLISIGESVNYLSPDQAQAITFIINDIFFTKNAVKLIGYGDSEEFNQVVASHQMMLERLENALVKVAEDYAHNRRADENQLQQHKQAVDSRLEAEKARLEQEHEARLAEVERLEQELEERKKALDDRDNTHARRQIRADLKSRISDHAKDFSLTGGTRSLRTPIHIVVATSLIALAAAAYFLGAASIQSLSPASTTGEIIVLALKPLGASIAALGILTWYIRWMNRWFERHAEAEFKLKQFELDVDRASWVVETALEWRQEQQAPMPDHLIESISRNLFSKSEKDEGADMHPADYLASALLGTASALKLKAGGAEIDLDRKGLNKLKQDEG